MYNFLLLVLLSTFIFRYFISNNTYILSSAVLLLDLTDEQHFGVARGLSTLVHKCIVLGPANF